jgi:hypothetical protein
MQEPKPLQEFKAVLLKSKAIKKLITQHYGLEAKERLKQFKAGEMDDLLDLIEDYKFEMSGSPVETIDGAAPDDDVFQIELWAVGPVYCIRANEFDNIGYFSSLEEARSYAECEFDGFISELADRGQDEEDSEESLDDESLASEEEKAWFKQHLSSGTCPVCRAPQSQCNHLLADIDLTFGSLDSGSLQEVYSEMCDFAAETGDSEEDDGPLMALYNFLLDGLTTWYQSDGDEDLGRPMSESSNVWFWDSDVAGVEQRVRDRFLPAKQELPPTRKSRQPSA